MVVDGVCVSKVVLWVRGRCLRRGGRIGGGEASLPIRAYLWWLCVC